MQHNKGNVAFIESLETMNTYHKFAPNVFIAKCTENHEKGETIELETKHGNTHECIVFNFIGVKDGFFFYSIVRADGFDHAAWANRRAERLANAAASANAKSGAYWAASNEGAAFLSLGEPIKVGHHSEKRHRALIERNHDRMRNSIECQKKAEVLAERASYWESKAAEINLSMPESIEFYEYEFEMAKAKHEGLKNGSIPRDHSFSLPYAKKAVNEAEKRLKLAQRLWA